MFTDTEVLLFNTNYSIQYKSFICTQLNCSKYCYVLLTIQLNIRSFVDIQLNDQTVLFPAILFKSFTCTQCKCQTVSGKYPWERFDPLIRPCQSGPGSNGNEGVVHISQSFRTETSPLDCLVSLQDIHWWRWEGIFLLNLQRCSQFILQSQLTGLGTL